MGAFIYGFDKDTPDIFNRTIEFVIENNLYDAQFSILTPFPGTKIRDKLKEENRLLPTSWENYSVADVNFIPKMMSIEQLQKGLIDSYRRINVESVYKKRMEHFKQIHRIVLQSQ
jgi:radical SAM superfamily enzyme YgiQ (UPF0313 family)